MSKVSTTTQISSDKIRQRITALEAERDQLIQVAQTRLNAYAAAIAELRQLIGLDDEASDA